MAKDAKQTGKQAASAAGKILSSPKVTPAQKTVAASDLGRHRRATRRTEGLPWACNQGSAQPILIAGINVVLDATPWSGLSIFLARRIWC